MNIKTILSLTFVGALILTSCKNEVAEDTTDATTTELPTSEIAEPVNQDVELNQQLTEESPNMLPQNTTAAPATSQRLNPEHGMPNHRCDIAVGAPLPM